MGEIMRMLLTLLVLVAAALPAMAGDRVIIVADHETKKVIKIKDDGTLLWDARNDNGHDVQLLANGHLLIVCGRTVQEIDADKKVVHEIGKPAVEAAESAQRLKNGNTVIADNGKMRVVEVNDKDEIVWTFDVPNNNKRPTPTMRQVRRLDNGNTLICASTEDEVLEVTPEKKVVWRYALPFPYLATRLANGNTLISSGSGYGSKEGYFLIEVDKDGKEVWKYGGADAPAEQKLNWPSGFVRLANGNTLISIARDGVIREVSADKKTVRTIKSPAMKHPCTMVVVEE
jgi:outer membrane protein assembly factor BamB